MKARKLSTKLALTESNLHKFNAQLDVDQEIVMYAYSIQAKILLYLTIESASAIVPQSLAPVLSQLLVHPPPVLVPQFITPQTQFIQPLQPGVHIVTLTKLPVQIALPAMSTSTPPPLLAVVPAVPPGPMPICSVVAPTSSISHKPTSTFTTADVPCPSVPTAVPFMPQPQPVPLNTQSAKIFKQLGTDGVNDIVRSLVSEYPLDKLVPVELLDYEYTATVTLHIHMNRAK